MYTTLRFFASRRCMLASALALSFAGCATSPPGPSNLADTIAQRAELSTLNNLVIKAGLVDTLKAQGPFTVFAPSNAAFKAVPATTLDKLAQNPDQLKQLLTYHIIPSKAMAADVKNSSVKSVNGAPLSLGKAGDFVTVESAAVTTADITATNGVIHIVDTVLMPPKK
jgi:uncharacterized surface protein with fasciclin (FAS1) repeats